MRTNEIYIRADRAPVEPLWGATDKYRDELTSQASAELRDKTKALFRKWERRHGFQEGAGELLLPAGYKP